MVRDNIRRGVAPLSICTERIFSLVNHNNLNIKKLNSNMLKHNDEYLILLTYMKHEAMRVAHIMLRDFLTQKSMDLKTVTDFRYPRACRFRKDQIENRLWELPLPTFLKT
jgi:hypothetical protein